MLAERFDFVFWTNRSLNDAHCAPNLASASGLEMLGWMDGWMDDWLHVGESHLISISSGCPRATHFARRVIHAIKPSARGGFGGLNGFTLFTWFGGSVWPRVSPYRCRASSSGNCNWSKSSLEPGFRLNEFAQYVRSFSFCFLQWFVKSSVTQPLMGASNLLNPFN